ncbi:glycosyltransferase [Hyphomonas sp. NPDC076900]|uniref:glycosyltransferase n=1 Tax=unclassified Hyphomonas TaxID=2630699 RepID=UPI003D06E53F
MVAGMFRTMNGIGKAAQLCYEGLIESGLSPIAVDTSGYLNQVQLPAPAPLGCLIPSTPGTLILFANPPEVERCLMALGLRRWHSWRIIGAWAWETPLAPPEWQRQAGFVSEIWAPSAFVAAAFSAAYDKPVKTVPHAVRAQPAAPGGAPIPETAPPPQDAPLHILTIGDARSSLERKNPLAALAMFQQAFAGNSHVRLTLKCRSLSLYPAYTARLMAAIGGDPRVTLLDETLSEAALATLLASADILLAPHRSEGFGLHLAEAMAAGKCVAATGWSGNLEFMTDANSALLPFRLIPVADETGVYAPQPGAVWADPDIAAGAEILACLAADPARRKQLGEAARQSIPGQLPGSAYARALTDA